ncbi:MAG TPA: hypothetical protein VEO00_04480 [Actinomycetota bacterium]|nr:hypothetical protein [Actinomycetota bacterium]
MNRPPSEAVRAVLAEAQRREEPGLVEKTGTLSGVRGEALLFHIARPPGAARPVGLVICHSFLEFALLQGEEIAFARAAARRGFATLYVEAPGMGDSAGASEDCSIEDRVGAALAGFAELRRRVPEVVRPCFVGAVLGGLVAALAAARAGDASLALWHPDLEPAAYWSEVRRMARVTALKQDRDVEDPQDALDRRGRAAVLGMRITRDQLADVFASAKGLPAGSAGGPAFVLALQDEGGRAQVAAVRRLVRGPVDVKDVPGRRGDVWHLGLRRGGQAGSWTLDWLEGVACAPPHAGDRGGRPEPARPEPMDPPSRPGEVPFFLPTSGGDLAAVASLPERGPLAGPPTLLLHSPFAPRPRGVAMLLLARRLADAGVPALRLDVPGSGLTPMADPDDRVRTIEILADAARWFAAACGEKALAVAGTCLGGRYALGVAARIPWTERVTAVAAPIRHASHRRRGLQGRRAPAPFQPGLPEDLRALPPTAEVTFVYGDQDAMYADFLALGDGGPADRRWEVVVRPGVRLHGFRELTIENESWVVDLLAERMAPAERASVAEPS